MRRRARPTTCSHSSCVPKARTPRMWVTVCASQPSVSMETLTTHLTCSPSLPALPTVFITSRSRCSSGAARRPAVVVAKDGQLPGLDDGLLANGLFPAGDVVEEELGDIGIVA